MHDIRIIRDNPQAFDAGLRMRNIEPTASQILALDRQVRERTGERQRLMAEQNALGPKIAMLQVQEQSRKVGAIIQGAATGKPVEIVENATLLELRQRVAGYKGQIAKIDKEESAVRVLLKNIMDVLPNTPAPDVPPGVSESENEEIRRIGPIPNHPFNDQQHDVLAAKLGLDFESAQKVAGARFAYLRGGVARLSRALGQLMLDRAVAAGYEEVAPPILVRDEAMYGTTQLPKFAEDSFRTTDGRWLIPTAEVSLTNIVREQILSEDVLPLRFTALTPCFRSEAGSAGRDTRGLIRQHQFDKVELVSIIAPEESDVEHERMTAAAESILDALALPYRRMLLCAGDMGFAAKKTYDLEVWLPGQGAYREISSCSNCGDFQARRMNARYRAGPKDNRFVHTLNGSALAVGRTLVAVLENYQNDDGSVTVPDALLPYTGGLTRLVPNGR